MFDLGMSTLQARTCMYEEQYNLIKFSSKTCGQSVIIVKYLSCCNFRILLHNLGWKRAKYTDKEKIRLGKKAPVSLPAKWNHMIIYKYKGNQDDMAYNIKRIVFTWIPHTPRTRCQPVLPNQPIDWLISAKLSPVLLCSSHATNASVPRYYIHSIPHLQTWISSDFSHQNLNFKCIWYDELRITDKTISW